jgi:hypothetical protein
VLDLPDRLLRYGHWGMDYSQIWITRLV